MKNYNNELHEIFTNILRGGVYGRTASGPRWAYFSEALYLINSGGGPFIGWHNYGSSANKCDLDNLLWIIENIFKTTPAVFLQEYECYFFGMYYEYNARYNGETITAYYSDNYTADAVVNDMADYFGIDPAAVVYNSCY